VKGVSATYDASADTVSATFGDTTEIVRYDAQTASGKANSAATVTLAFGGPRAGARTRCHFDLSERTATGTLSPVAEDLRDFLRRRTIRIYTDSPFRPLPPANVERLRKRLQSLR
jgi:hypothetical protein